MKLSLNIHFLTVSHTNIIIRRILKHKGNKFNTERHTIRQNWVKVDISAF